MKDQAKFGVCVKKNEHDGEQLKSLQCKEKASEDICELPFASQLVFRRLYYCNLHQDQVNI